MILILLLLIPLLGIFIISSVSYANKTKGYSLLTLNQIKMIGLSFLIINFFVCLIVFMLFDFSSEQFVQEYHKISSFDFYLEVDGISIYSVLLITIIMPIFLLSNWSSINQNVTSYLIIRLLLETLWLAVFLVLDNLLCYIFMGFIIFFYIII